jgi:hypothetical protein
VSDRYADGVRTRALDAYVLDSIGLLDASTIAELDGRRDEIAAALGSAPQAVDGAASWREVVESATGMPEGADDELRRIWAFAVLSAESEGRTPDALAFVHETVDATFPHE